MLGANSRIPYGIGAVGAALGLYFGWVSTTDYAKHLDRNLHDLHCSFIPGAAATEEAEACRAALYSPYSALLKEDYWGGIPISLFAIGAFCFFLGFSLYMAFAGGNAAKKAVVFYGVIGLTPLIVSAVMFTISLTQLGQFCKTCVGIYIASFVLAIGGLLGFATLKPAASVGPTGTVHDAPAAGPTGRPAMSILFPFAWLAALGLVTATPAYVYAASMPDHKPYLGKCGKLKAPEDKHKALLRMQGPKGVQPVTLFEDPLCPTCKAFHERLVGENILSKLQITMVMFPLDNECNWMLDRPLHPGACVVSKAVLCGGPNSLKILEWAFENQEQLTAAGKQGPDSVKRAVEQRWGAEVATCIDAKKTKKRLDRHLHYAVDNAIPVSTPQMFLGTTRMCEEDTDIGLVYTLKQLAPDVLK